jgi:hypothetical protein
LILNAMENSSSGKFERTKEKNRPEACKPQSYSVRVLQKAIGEPASVAASKSAGAPKHRPSFLPYQS